MTCVGAGTKRAETDNIQVIFHRGYTEEYKHFGLSISKKLRLDGNLLITVDVLLPWIKLCCSTERLSIWGLFQQGNSISWAILFSMSYTVLCSLPSCFSVLIFLISQSFGRNYKSRSNTFVQWSKTRYWWSFSFVLENPTQNVYILYYECK